MGASSPTPTAAGASNRVTVINRKVDRSGQLLDAMVAAGANEISGPTFSIEDDTAQRKKARVMALQTALAQATEYAQASGHASVRLLEINETVMRGRMMTADVMSTSIAVTGAAKTPVEPGQVGTSVQITVKYEMVR